MVYWGSTFWWEITIFYGKTRDFHWVIFNSSVSLPEGNTMKNPSIWVGKRHEHGICNWEWDAGDDMGMQKWMGPVWRFHCHESMWVNYGKLE